LDRRQFLQVAAATAVSGWLTPLGCHDPERYTEADARSLEQQWRAEAAASGTGPDGPQLYEGYRGLAKLPWFEWDAERGLRCVDESVPLAVDIHAHLAIWLLFAPAVDLNASSERVEYNQDCEADEPPCPIDLDV
jgi:hypothetical protein